MKVRVNSKYTFVAAGWDVFDPNSSAPENGTLVKVINKYGCPKANTMGHAYIENAKTQEFYGLVSTNSLSK